MEVSGIEVERDCTHVFEINEDVLPSVLKYVSTEELIPLRLVSKMWNSGVLHELKKRKWTLKIPRWPYDLEINLEETVANMPETLFVNQEWDLERIQLISAKTIAITSTYLPLLMRAEHIVIKKPFDMKYAEWRKLSSRDRIYVNILRRLNTSKRLKSLTLVSGKPTRFDAMRYNWCKSRCAEAGAVLNVDFGVGERNVQWAVTEVGIREFNGFMINHVLPSDRNVVYAHWIKNCVINMPTNDEGDISPYQWICRARRLANSDLHIVRLIITCLGFELVSKRSFENLLSSLADVIMATCSSLEYLKVPTLRFLELRNNENEFPRLLELDVSEDVKILDKVNPEGVSSEFVKFVTSLWGAERLHMRRPWIKVFPVLKCLRLNEGLLCSFLQNRRNVSSPIYSVQVVILTGNHHGDINLDNFSVQFPNGCIKPA